MLADRLEKFLQGQLMKHYIGAISDAIADGGTGFSLESTAPDHIAVRVTTILNYGELDKVADNAEGFTKPTFTRAVATERLDRILKEELLEVRRPRD